MPAAMDPQRWAVVKEHFAAMMALATEDRAAALATIADLPLRADVSALLASSDDVGDRFEAVPVIHGDAPPDPVGPPGDQLGPWHLGALLGEGGMGMVFAAERTEGGFAKRAAIKVLARVGARADLVARFEQERRMLARLEHRNIAALLDGGVTADGRPWFAMEFVDGMRLDTWCDAQGLDLRARVKLFRQVCTAVQHAHERLIVHRDLKPANILVSADGTVKLLDFGIAKLMDDPDSPRTTTGLSPMTTAYASPEQRAGQLVTTATDIYSLGVVLHELVTGERPAPPSPEPRSRALRGDLAAIVQTALRPEPARRYASAQALADDLQAWLDGRTVRARPDSLGYRLRTLVRRHPVNTAWTVLAIVALVAAAVTTGQQAQVARRERDAALLAERTALRVTTFLEEVIRRARPRADGAQVSLVTAIRNATPYLDTAFAGDADLQARVRATVASTLGELQLTTAARPLLDAALAHYRRRDGAAISAEQASVLWSLSANLGTEGDRAGSDSILRLLLPVYERGDFPPNKALEARAWLAENQASAGEPRAALRAYDAIIPRYLPASRTDSVFLATMIANRGGVRTSLGDFGRGSDDLLRATALLDRVNPQETADRAAMMQPLAMALLFSARLAEAESVARRALAIERRVAGDSAVGQAAHLRTLGLILLAQRRPHHADSAFSAVLAMRGARLPDADPSISVALAHRAWSRAMRGELRGVVTDAREAVRLVQLRYAPGTPQRSLVESVSGAALGFGGAAHRAEAHRLMRTGLAGLESALEPAHPRVTEARARLAEFERRTRVP